MGLRTGSGYDRVRDLVVEGGVFKILLDDGAAVAVGAGDWHRQYWPLLAALLLWHETGEPLEGVVFESRFEPMGIRSYLLK